MASASDAVKDSILDTTSPFYFWNRVNKTTKPAVYKLKVGGKLIGASDFEGVSFSMFNLFENPEVVNTNIIHTEPQSLANLMKEFLVSNSDGGIQVAKPDDIFYFSGDVWGVGPRNIQLLRQLINMNNNIMLYGNRDINRGRWTIETELTIDSRQSLIKAMKKFNTRQIDWFEQLNHVDISFKYTIPKGSSESYDGDIPFTYLWKWGVILKPLHRQSL